MSAAPAPDRKALLSVTGAHIIEDHQVWGSVVVNQGSRLVVANGGHLETTNIELKEGSTLDVRGGLITLENHTHADRVGIFGECDRFIVTHRSVVRAVGPAGAYDVAGSGGGDAVIQVRARKAVRVEGSTINLTGGPGLSPPEPLTGGDVDGQAFRGGDAVLELGTTDPDPLFVIRNSDIDILGGDGGDAPDGLPPPGPDAGGRGGGFTRGGDVSGSVAGGGEARMALRGVFVDVHGMQLHVTGGDGGDAGDGGATDPGDRAGGGGGGYSGGDGAFPDLPLPAGNGGQVSDRVGAGGGARFLLQGDYHNVTESLVDVLGGDGGEAGDGGPSRGRGGGGGGGYSGGGGGAQGSWDGGDGGGVSVHVGSGGEAEAEFLVGALLRIESTGVLATGGRGGRAGSGGNASSTGGAGGGGGSGGGGGAQGAEDGSSDGTDGGKGGAVEGLTSAGGDARIEMTSERLVFLGGVSRARAGYGGDEGEAGTYAEDSDHGTLGGAGGGGRSAGGGAGGGAGSAAGGSPGVGSDVHQSVGEGGTSTNRIVSAMATVSRDTTVASQPGAGGEVRDEVQGGPLEGYSVSGDDLPGGRAMHVPMSLTLLREPAHESSVFLLPVFRWVALHDSTEHGRVVSYIVVVDDDEDFSSPEKLLEVPTTKLNGSGLKFGVHYWYVRAVYGGEDRTFGPASAVGWFSFYNAPPRFHMIDPTGVQERKATKVDLSRNIFDPDTPMENLTLDSTDPRVLSIEGVTMTLYFDGPSPLEWVYFSISDGHSTKWFNLPVTVVDVNDPPVIMSVGGQPVPAVLQVTEGELEYFEIVAEDRDGEALEYTLLTTWQDMRIIGDDTIRVWARHGMLGERTAKLLVEDERHAVTTTRITVRVLNRADPPESIEVYGPKEGSTHRRLDPVVFTVRVNDPDLVWGEEVNVTWESDVSGQLAVKRTNGLASVTVTDLPVGAHVITITASDGHAETRETMHITIEELPDPPRTEEPVQEGIPPLAILLLILMPTLGYYLGRKGVLHARR